jgi:hypothetical protein
VVGQGRLAHLLEDGAVRLRAQGVLDELLGDGRAALDRLAAHHVLDEGAADAADVDARVLVEAAVLDGDDRIAHVGRDVPVAHEHAALVVGQDAKRLPLRVLEDRVARVLVLLAVLQVGQIGGDGHHHPEDRRDDGQQRERQEDGQQAQLLHARANPLGWLRRLAIAEQRRDVRSVLDAHAAGVQRGVRGRCRGGRERRHGASRRRSTLALPRDGNPR